MFVAVPDPSDKSKVFCPYRGRVGQENFQHFLCLQLWRRKIWILDQRILATPGHDPTNAILANRTLCLLKTQQKYNLLHQPSLLLKACAKENLETSLEIFNILDYKHVLFFCGAFYTWSTSKLVCFGQALISRIFKFPQLSFFYWQKASRKDKRQ